METSGGLFYEFKLDFLLQIRLKKKSFSFETIFEFTNSEIDSHDRWMAWVQMVSFSSAFH